MTPTRAHVWLGLAACSAMGCHLISGVGDLEFVDSGPGGATSTASGGHAGSSPTGGTGGTGAGAQAGAAPCHPAGLEDDFDSGDYDHALWSLNADAQTGVQNGRWFVAPDPAAAVGQSGILFSQSLYDHRECSAWVEVPTVFDASVVGDARFYLWGSHNNVSKIAVAGGIITFDVITDGIETSVASLPYDAVAHRWWRLRETAGTLFYETSPDALDWTVRHSVADPPYINSATVELGGATTGPMAAVGSIEFDNVDLLP
jgi:hypothetical protein